MKAFIKIFRFFPPETAHHLALLSLKILNRLMPTKNIEFNSGKNIFDWKVPKEWIIEDAYIITPDGKKICDFSENNLTKIAERITDLGYWGFSVSFNDPNDSEQIKNAKKILQHTKNGFVNFKITRKGRQLDSNLILPSTDLIIDNSNITVPQLIIL